MSRRGLVVRLGLAIVAALFFSTLSKAEEVCWLNHLHNGFEKAIAENKPLVVYFSADRDWGLKMTEEVIKKGVFDDLADEAVFVEAREADEDDKGNYARLRKDLKVDKLPSIVILHTEKAGLREIGRIVGYFEAKECIANFAKLIQAWRTMHPEAVSEVGSSNPFLPETWSTYRCAGLGFEAAFPCRPQMAYANALQKQYTYASKDKDGSTMTLTVQSAPGKEKAASDEVEWLRVHATTRAKVWGGELAELKCFMTNGKNACQFKAVPFGGGQPAEMRAVIAHGRVYTLTAACAPEKSENEARFFLQSLVCLDPAVVNIDTTGP